MRRKRLWVIALVVLVAVALVSWLVLSTRSSVNEALVARIQVGMTRAEVEELIGPPDRTGGPREEPTKGAWLGDEGVWFIEFDANSKVRLVTFKKMSITTLDRIEIRGEERLHQMGW